MIYIEPACHKRCHAGHTIGGQYLSYWVINWSQKRPVVFKALHKELGQKVNIKF